jgi:hypothetical protein
VHYERRTFADVVAIQKHVTKVQQTIPKKTFADSFQQLYESCQQCVLEDGDYFDGQEVNLFLSSVLFVFWYHSPNVLDTPHSCQLSMATRQEQCSEHEVRIIKRVFNERDKSA